MADFWQENGITQQFSALRSENIFVGPETDHGGGLPCSCFQESQFPEWQAHADQHEREEFWRHTVVEHLWGGGTLTFEWVWVPASCTSMSAGHNGKSQRRLQPWSAYRRLPGCVVMGINRTRRLFGRQKKDAWAASQYTLYGFRPRCYHFLSPLFCFFSLWSRKLHFRYTHRYFLDIHDTLEQSKELSRRGFWLDNRCLKMTIGFTLLLHFFTFAEEVLRTSSSAKDPELTWIFVSAIPERK